MNKVDKIIIHCTATPEGRNVQFADVEKWHKSKGYKKIGYHYLILLNGTIVKGRAESEAGAHTIGQNDKSIGVCYVGGLDKNMQPKDTRTPYQATALIKLLKELKGRYPNAVIYGHRDFARKACPSFNAKAEYANL